MLVSGFRIDCDGDGCTETLLTFDNAEIIYVEDEEAAQNNLYHQELCDGWVRRDSKDYCKDCQSEDGEEE